MFRTMHQSVLSLLVLFLLGTTALPTATEQPTQTVEERDSSSGDIIDNVFAAAAIGQAKKSKGFGGGANKEDQCNLAQATMPALPGAATPLPLPSGTVAYVAVGRGTQNYTCDPSQPSATPNPVGAVANLYDASCVAGKYSFLLNLMPSIALQFPTPTNPTDQLVSMGLLGHHYFTDPKSPTFNLNTANGNAGYVNVQSGGKASAPSGAPIGQNNQGFGAVPWLQLPAKSGPQGAQGQQTFKDVYRVNTAGGNPPSTCQGMPAAFEVEYAAEYWFYK